MKKSTIMRDFRIYLKGGILLLFLQLLFSSSSLIAEEEKVLNIQPLPDITITCDFWFPFDPNNPNNNVNDFDNIFGKMRVGTTSGRDSINIMDRVCPNHPRFAEFAPPSQFDDPCYDDQYRMYWGKDGYALGYGNIPLEQIIEPNLSCGQGEIIRKWRQPGGWQFITEQRITIINCKEFWVPTQCWRFTPKDVGECDLAPGTVYRTKLIEWPCDVEIQNCQGMQGNDIFDPDNLPVNFEMDRRPRLDDDHCSLMAATYTDQIFPAVDSVCVKLFRNWKVIDWCLYDQSLNGTYTGAYEWTFTQVIKLANTNTPDFASCEDTTYCGYGPGCEGAIEIRPSISDDCTALADLRIDYKIDLFNDGDFDLLGYSDNQGSVYPFPNPGNLPVSSFEATDANADGTYPVGTHRIFWGAEDGCGNANVCAYLFTVEDCKPPTAYCEIGISTIPMPVEAGAFVEIWASDFDLGSTDNCIVYDTVDIPGHNCPTITSNLTFSFSTDINDGVRRLTCADAGSQIDYTIYVWDEAGNYSSCLVGVVLNGCPGNSSDELTINYKTEDGREVEDVSLRISASNGASFIYDNFLTSGTNVVEIEPQDLPANFPAPYTLEPFKNSDVRNGVTTFDLIKIGRHILAVESLDSPYKMLAADVNTSEVISTLDMVQLRMVVLFLTQSFPGGINSWGFVREDYVFENPANPLSEMITSTITTDSILNLKGNYTFIGYKLGDVNLSADPAGLVNNDSEDRSADPVYLNVEDRSLIAGRTYPIKLRLTDDARLLGLQFSLQLDTRLAEVVEWTPGKINGLNKSNFNAEMTDRGLLLGTWASSEGTQFDDEEFMTVYLRAKQNVRLSDILTFSTDYLAAEAYSEGEGSHSIDIHNLKLRFTTPDEAINNEFILIGNQPNPFRQQTTISFSQPQSGVVNLQVYDVLGRSVFESSDNYDAGVQQITIHQSDLQNTGVYYFQLHRNNEIQRGSLMLIE